MASAIKFAFLMGKAPADFAAMASKMYPVVVATPLVRPFGLTSSQFILILAAFEMAAAVGFFFNNRVPAMMVVAVMAGAEYIGFTQVSNPAMPPNPVCGDKASCMGSHIFHLVIVIMAVISYMASDPLCKAWSNCSCWSVSGKTASKAAATPEVRTPSRPRRAAAMKNKKDE